jgi:hypothetical protein
MGCGALFPACAGPTHRYMESSPACWSAYCEVLAREYANPVVFRKVHRFTVDAFAVQHPGRPSPQAIQSVAVHLVSLCAVLENDSSVGWARKLMLDGAAHKDRYTWLPPPRSRGLVTVADVWRATSPAEHEALAKAWAESAWEAWASHHGTVRRWLASADSTL